MKNHQLFIYFICLVSAMGGLLFGYDWVVIGGAKPFYEEYFHIAGDEGMQALAMSIALLGCLLGATMAGFLADRYGRKKLLVLSAFIFFASSWATGAATTIPTFIIARLVGGMAIGLAADLSPMYIAEVAPTQIRGKLVTLNQLTIVLGILGAQIVNMLIAEPVPEGATAADILNSWNGQTGWRWMFWAVCVPSGLFFLLALFIPESPRWLASMKQMEKARKVLCSIGGAAYADSEIENYTRAGAASHAEKGVLSLLFSSKMRNVLIIGIVVAMFQQWSGTNVIFNYAQEIFQAAGYGISDVLMNIVVTGIANPRPLVKYLKGFQAQIRVMHYPDHHYFSRTDIDDIVSTFRSLKGRYKILMTTEKDAVRIANNPYFPFELKKHIFYQPVSVEFLSYESENFDDALMKAINRTIQ